MGFIFICFLVIGLAAVGIIAAAGLGRAAPGNENMSPSDWVIFICVPLMGVSFLAGAIRLAMLAVEHGGW